MPMTAFEAALPFVLRWEGGFVDHPNDPGGRTNRGVTQGVYDDWRRRHGLLRADVREIEEAEVQQIYESGYWFPPRCDLLARTLDLVQFDTAVNMGPGRAVRFLQGAIGAAVDGDFGPATRHAVAGCDIAVAVVQYCDARERYYRELAARKPELGVFLKGWLNRLNALRHEVGLPGFEAVPEHDPGTGVAARIPDIGVNRDYDF